MIKITRFFYIHILTIPLFVLAYFTKTLHTLLMAYSVVTVHELFHLFAALLLKVRTGSIIIMPFGMTLRLSGAIIKQPSKEILIALAGPAANALMLLAGIFFKRMYIWAEQSMFLYWYLNIITMLLNLIPVLPLDGGRVLRALLTHFLGYIAGIRIMRKITVVISCVLLFAGGVLLIITKLNMSLIVAAAFLLFNMMEEKKSADLFILKEILFSKEKLKEQKLMPTGIITATENARAKNVLSKISYDKYFLIYVENGGDGRFISESELINALLNHGYGLKINQIQ